MSQIEKLDFLNNPLFTTEEAPIVKSRENNSYSNPLLGPMENET